jgi:hypothetical protein
MQADLTAIKKKDFNDFLTSIHQMGRILRGEKLAGMKVTYRTKPEGAQEVRNIHKRSGHLKFIKPTPKEAKAIEKAVKQTDKSGKWISAKELLKKYHAR